MGTGALFWCPDLIALESGSSFIVLVAALIFSVSMSKGRPAFCLGE